MSDLPERIVAWPARQLMWGIEKAAGGLPEGCGVYVAEDKLRRMQASIVELRSALREICDSASMTAVADCRIVAEEALRRSARKS